MTLPKISFEWSVNLGAVIQLGGVLVAALVLYGAGLRFQYTTEAGLADYFTTKDKYTPVMDTLVSSDRAQEFRIQQLTATTTELRQLLLSQTKQLSDIATDVAVVKEKVSVEQKK